MAERESSSNSKIGYGCSTFGFVLAGGLICSALGIGIGGGVSFRIPFTEVNVSAGGAVGRKDLTQRALPNYLRNRVADNTNFFNHTGTMTIWVAEGMDVVVIGRQPEAPLIDINISTAS